MKTQIKFPLTVEKYLSPALGKQDKLSNQDENTRPAGEIAIGFKDLEDSTSDGQVNPRKKANPRLRIL
jgi:hypothetical protein